MRRARRLRGDRVKSALEGRSELMAGQAIGEAAAEFGEEPLKPGRRDQNECSGISSGAEAVAGTAGDVHPASRCGLDLVVVEDEGKAAVEDVDALLAFAVHM